MQHIVTFSESYLQVVTTANAMANDSSSTTLGIQFKASFVAAACVSLALKTQGYKSLSLEKWLKKWNEERAVEQEPRFQSVVIVKEVHEGVFSLLVFQKYYFLTFWNRNLQSIARLV